MDSHGLVADLNRHLNGWAQYFSYGYPRVTRCQINRFVRDRLTRHFVCPELCAAARDQGDSGCETPRPGSRREDREAPRFIDSGSDAPKLVVGPRPHLLPGPPSGFPLLNHGTA